MKVLTYREKTVVSENLIEKISLECGILKDTARLLAYRNIDTVEKAKKFLNPDKKHFYNPFLLKGISEAIDRINVAKANGETVLIFGDYDVDGICATTVLYNTLTEYGIKTHAVIPERDDGYGLNVDLIKKITETTKIDLIITVDCGISDKEKIESIIKSGINVIVTDHHEPPKELPNTICINPKIEGQDYPFTGLCGAGVAYKLCYALSGEKVNKYLDFVCLATVADSMDLIDENRDIVYEGLKLFNGNNVRPCFKYLLGDVTKQVTAQTLVYTIAPRINAGGRLGDANSALNLFLEDDETERYNLAIRLNTYNMERQAECDRIYNEAKAVIIDKKLFNDSVILIYNENWRTGFVGIVASRLVEDYGRPCIVFAGYDGYLKGSARSVEDVNIYNAISSVKDVLTGFGGHAQAAGVSIEKKDFPYFKKQILTYFSNIEYKAEKEKTVYCEWEVKGEFDKQFAREIELLEPFGVGNKRPTFITEAGAVKSSPIKQNSTHCSFFTECLEMMHFNGVKDCEVLNLPIKKKILFETNVSTFKNKEYVKGYVKNVIVDFDDLDSVKPFIFDRELQKCAEYEPAKNYQTYKEDDKANVGKCFITSGLFDIDKKYSALPKYLFYRDDKRIDDCVIISADEIPLSCNKAVYLDYPFCDIKTDSESYLSPIKTNSEIINSLLTVREEMSKVFFALKGMVNKPFYSVVKAFYTQKEIENIYQFIFSARVFLELKFFTVENGFLRYNANIKNELNNSKIYNVISKMKENDV